MKKIFGLTSQKKAPAQHIDSVKHEIKKYIARERRKKLPEGIDFWDFDCKIGPNSERSVVIHVAEINKKIDSLVADKLESFYMEIVAKPAKRSKKPVTPQG